MVITADVKKRRHVLYVMSSLLKHHIKTKQTIRIIQLQRKRWTVKTNQHEME